MLDESPNGTSTVHTAPPPERPGLGPPVTAAARPERRSRLTRRHGWRLGLLALVLMVLGAAVGYGGALLLPPRYAAQADIYYALTREQPTGFLREDRNITTQTVLLTSRTVLQPAADAYQIPVDDLAARITPSVIEQSEIIHVELVDSDPDRALQLLRQVVQRYLEVSNESVRGDVQTYLDGQLREVLTRLEQAPSQGERGPLVDREQDLRAQLDELNLADLAGPGASILVEPYVPATPVYPKPVLAGLTGALAGLLVAAVAVAVFARRLTRP